MQLSQLDALPGCGSAYPSLTRFFLQVCVNDSDNTVLYKCAKLHDLDLVILVAGLRAVVRPITN